MSGAMFVEAFVLIGVFWLGLIPASTLFGAQHGLMVPAMIIPMLFRLDLYTGRAGHVEPTPETAPSPVALVRR
jgi:hypothetical protein